MGNIAQRFLTWLRAAETDRSKATGPQGEVIVDLGEEVDPNGPPFVEWPSIPRLFRDIRVTEKIDGMSACVIVEQYPYGTSSGLERAGYAPKVAAVVMGPVTDDNLPEVEYWVSAQSRKFVLRPGEPDSHGFRTWVEQHAVTLVADLGIGRHFGEFWGPKVRKSYGLTERRFSLFNPDFHFQNIEGDRPPVILTPGLGTVPLLYEGPFDTAAIANVLADLRENGSVAAPGFMWPEGAVVYHTAARRIIGKVTLDNQDAGKWERGAQDESAAG